MLSFTNPSRLAIATVLAVATLGASTVAHARSDVSISIGIQVPARSAFYPGRVYVPQQPVYIQPQPVYVQPRPVYVQPAPVFIRPRPVVAYPPAIGYYYRPAPHWQHGHWKKQQRHGSHGQWRDRA